MSDDNELTAHHAGFEAWWEGYVKRHGRRYHRSFPSEAAAFAAGRAEGQAEVAKLRATVEQALPILAVARHAASNNAPYWEGIYGNDIRSVEEKARALLGQEPRL